MMHQDSTSPFYTMTYNDPKEDRTESLEMGEFDLFMDRNGILRVYRGDQEVVKLYPTPPKTGEGE